MTILGRGDLSPPRRYRHGTRRRRWPRLLLALVVIAALAAGGYYGWQRWHDTSTASLGPAPTPCRTSASPAPLSTTPTSSHPVRVLNGSLRSGLAAGVARTLHRRFHVLVGGVGNAAHFVRGASLVRYPSRLAGDAKWVAAMVVPAPRLVAAPFVAKVELDIGTAFRRTATVEEFTATYGHATSSPTPSPTPSGCTSP